MEIPVGLDCTLFGSNQLPVIGKERDCMLQIKREEFENLKSQIATPRSDWGGRCKFPLVFGETSLRKLISCTLFGSC